MRSTGVALPLAALLLAVVGPACAQQAGPVAAPSRFESWQAASPAHATGRPTLAPLGMPARNRTRHALLGGAIGAATGVVACTAVSTLTNDSAEGGLSFCPLDSYLLIGGAGFVLGAVIGWVI
jgi:hypothetical protein